MAAAPGASEVHIWSCSLERAAEEVAARASDLSSDERDRAGRFRFEDDRRRFIVARSVLRERLADYLGERADRLTFSYDAHGKPRLARAAGDPPLFFNASHSHEVALYAIAPVDRIGIDVEHVRPMTDLDAIARRFFSAPEQSALAALDGEARTAAFFRCWTRKEALLKALGGGVTLLPLDRVDVSDWSLHDLRAPEGYAAAVALPRGGWRIVYLPSHDA